MRRLILPLPFYDGVSRVLAANPHWRFLFISLVVWLGYVVQFSTTHAHHVVSHHASWPLFDNITAWLLMVCAMMLPLLSDAVRFITQSMPRYQHEKVIALFALGYFAVWLAIGIALEAVTYGIFALSLGDVAAGWPVATLAFLAAGIWNSLRWRRKAVFACRNGIAMRIHGWPVIVDSIQFGFIKGKQCAIRCVHLMLAVIVAGHDLWLMAVVTGVLLYERTVLPQQTKWVTGVCFVLSGGYFLHWVFVP